MIKHAGKEAMRDISPPAIVVGSSVMGIPLQDWALYIAIVYSLIRLMMLFPKIIGCGSCFYRNRTCTLACKKPAE